MKVDGQARLLELALVFSTAEQLVGDEHDGFSSEIRMNFACSWTESLPDRIPTVATYKYARKYSKATDVILFSEAVIEIKTF